MVTTSNTIAAMRIHIAYGRKMPPIYFDLCSLITHAWRYVWRSGLCLCYYYTLLPVLRTVLSWVSRCGRRQSHFWPYTGRVLRTWRFSPENPDIYTAWILSGKIEHFRFLRIGFRTGHAQDRTCYYTKNIFQDSSWGPSTEHVTPCNRGIRVRRGFSMSGWALGSIAMAVFKKRDRPSLVYTFTRAKPS